METFDYEFDCPHSINSEHKRELAIRITEAFKIFDAFYHMVTDTIEKYHRYDEGSSDIAALTKSMYAKHHRSLWDIFSRVLVYDFIRERDPSLKWEHTSAVDIAHIDINEPVVDDVN
jgi:hypothetical protein